MKIFTPSIITHRKVIIIFLLAIFIPSLIAAYISLSTFPKRREAVKKLLESNLWISGESALKSIEGTILELEQKALTSENFVLLSVGKNSASLNPSLQSTDSLGDLFLLDSDFKLIKPETGFRNTLDIQWDRELKDDRFAKIYQRAEFYEFSQKEYVKAAELYREYLSAPSSAKFRPIALEATGRCLFLSGNLNEANSVYQELLDNHSQKLNRAGHPFGIIAMLQLYEIAGVRKDDKTSFGILLNLYRQIRNGTWLIDQPTYDFYIAEIESILNNNLAEKYPDVQKSYSEIKKQQSSYQQTLVFTDFLQRNIVPVIKEKSTLLQAQSAINQDRFSITSDIEFCMVSFTSLPDFLSGQTFYGGIYWDLDFLKNKMIPGILEGLSKDSGFDFKIIDDGTDNRGSEKEEFTYGESQALAFRIFPLPWNLLVSNPEMKALEKSAQREILFYGILLGVILALMLFGAFLIARDISRESETTRLKTEFVNNISHELKTPLTLIRLYGETLQRKENLTTREKRECYEIITKESERLSHLINNVLDFSRIEMEKKEFDLKKGYLQDVIRETLESYRYHLEKKGFSVLSNISSDLPEMNFDGEAIASVLINLLSNVIRFSQAEKEVTVKLFGYDGNAVLQVADKGIGISQNDIPKIFQRFYQSANKTAESRGSGLGLTLVKHIVEAHRGTIEVESEVGKGSRFTVRIPLSGI